MRSYCALYIDAGYLFAGASMYATGTSLRSASDVDVAGFITDLIAYVEHDSGLPLLRVLWYDSGSRQGTPDSQQRQVGSLSRVKLRLGRSGYNGEQKGVDLKLCLDLIEYARNNSAEIVYLVSGDDDLTEAVETAQGLGTQVRVLALPIKNAEGRAYAVSRNLQMTVDELQLIPTEMLTSRVRQPSPVQLPEVVELQSAQRRPTPSDVAAMAVDRAPAVLPASSLVYTSSKVVVKQNFTVSEFQEGVLELVVTSLISSWWRTATPTQQRELIEAKPAIPPELDRIMLLDAAAALEVDELELGLRYRMRALFWHHIERLLRPNSNSA